MTTPSSDKPLITVAQAAILAERSKATIHRWIEQGFLPIAYRVDGFNGPLLLDEEHFRRVLPGLKNELRKRLDTKELRPDTSVDRRSRAYREQNVKGVDDVED